MGLKVTPLLLLLLLLLVALLVAGAYEKNEPYEWFLTQHYDRNPRNSKDYCTEHMKKVMREAKRRNQEPGPIPWKERNTIIHGNINDVRDICIDKGGKKLTGNKHQSLKQFQVTLCVLPPQKQIQTAKTHTNPKYQATKDSRIIVIGCDEKNFPMHFDESWKPLTNQ